MEPAELRNSVPRERAVPFRLYVGTVVVAGAAISAAPLAELPSRLADLPAAFWAMAVLAVLVDARPFTPPGRWQSAAVCPSVCFTFAILLAWGLGPAVAVQAAAVVVTSVRLRHAPWRAAFNIAQYALALAAARAVTRLAGPAPFTPADGAFPVPRWTDILVAVVAGLAWFLVTYLAVTTAVQLRFGGTWRTPAWAFELLSAGALLALSPILLAAAHTTPALIPLVLVPLYAVYRMARLSSEQDRAAAVDALTGLASRKALVTEATAQTGRHADRAARGAPDPHLALVLIDLDRFKHVNDALGHAVGDRLLVEVGHRLRHIVRPVDLVARLGGDEFAILAPDLPDGAAARDLANGIAAALSAPVNLDGLPVDVAGSIGVAVYPEHGADFATLLRHADVAMYDAKHAGGPVRVYSPESDRNSAQQLGLLADLRRALTPPPVGAAPGADPRTAPAAGAARPAGGAARPAGEAGEAGELGMFYQPQVEITTGAVVGVEALLRWRHPKRGLVDPEELIRVAEQSAVMSVLTRRVVDEVVAQVAAWQAAGIQLRVSLNVSVRDLHSGEIADQIVDRLARHGVPPQLIQLEITEGALMADPCRVLATIARLDRIGVAIALDDFGTGYSSLQHLRRLPLTEVKVDRSFVLGMGRDPDDAVIVRSIIELARALGLRVVAEGVEDEATWRMLHAAGCHVAQGWFHARPMPPVQLMDWLARYRPPRLLAHGPLPGQPGPHPPAAAAPAQPSPSSPPVPPPTSAGAARPRA